MAKDPIAELTSSRRLIKGTIWSFASTALPAVAALLAIPVLLRGMGVDRFGVLALVWVAIGFFGLLDLGVGRALAKLVAERLGARTPHHVNGLAWTGLTIVTIAGFVGALILVVFTPFLVDDVLRIPDRLRWETTASFRLVAVSFPFILGSTLWRSILEAYQRFDLISYARIPLVSLSFLAPAALVHFRSDLPWVIGLLVVIRIALWLLYSLMVFRAIPDITPAFRFDRNVVNPLLTLGGWMTVSSVTVPLMTYADRYFIGAVISLEAVSFYAIPHEVATRVWILPMAIMGVVFPAFSTVLAQGRTERATKLYERVVAVIFGFLFALVMLLVTFAGEGLRLWVGPEIPTESVRILQILAFGVLVNGVAQVPFGLVQATGRADLTAKSHLIQLPIYGVALWWLIGWLGTTGAAIAWVIRVVLNTIIVFFIAAMLLPSSRRVALRVAALMVLASIALVLGVTLSQAPLGPLYSLTIAVAFLWISRFVFAPSPRSSLGGAVRRWGVNVLVTIWEVLRKPGLARILKPVLRRIVPAIVGNRRGHISVRSLEGMKVTTWTSELWRAAAFATGRYEPATTRAVRALSVASALFIDVGAHVGYYTLLTSPSLVSGHVVAIEPSSENYKLLCHNIAANDLRNVTALRRAAADVSNDQRMLWLAPGHSGGHSLWRGAHSGGGSEIVDTIAIDDLLDGLSIPTEPALVKIDVEGSELEVLKGMDRVLKRGQTSVIVEVNSNTLSRFGVSVKEVWESLHQVGLCTILLLDDMTNSIHSLRSLAELEDRVGEEWKNLLASPNMTRVHGLLAEG